MRLKNYLNEMVDKSSASGFINRWKNELKNTYGLTHAEFSTHFSNERLNHPRNKPAITIEEMDAILKAFFEKVGPQFKKDVENVKKHIAKPRGKDKKKLNFNELEFTVWNKKSGIKFVFVLKQDRKQKGTAMILPMTVIRDKKKLIHKQGELVEVEI